MTTKTTKTEAPEDTEAPEVSESADLDTLASEPSFLTLESGFEVNVVRLKTRQLFKLLKVITRGVGPVLSNLSFSQETSTEEFTSTLLTAVLLAIPEAEDESIEFIRGMVEPANLIERPKSKPEKEVNAGLELELDDALTDNPELEDTVAIIERVIRVEAPHIQALGKRLAVLLRAQQMSTTAKQSASSLNSEKS